MVGSHSLLSLSASQRRVEVPATLPELCKGLPEWLLQGLASCRNAGAFSAFSRSGSGALLVRLLYHLTNRYFTSDPTGRWIRDRDEGVISDQSSMACKSPVQGVRTVLGHSRVVHSASYSADGTRIVSASQDNTVRVWDATTIGANGA